MASPAFRGSRLAEARQAAHLTREQLAAAIGGATLSGVSRIRLWERGAEQPRPGAIPRLARALQVDPLELLDVDPTDPPLAALRTAAGLSVRQLSAAAGMSVMSYQRLERGAARAEPGDSTVDAVAAALTLPVEQVHRALNRSRLDHAD